MKKYSSPEIEITETPDIVTSSGEVETDNIPLYTYDEKGTYQF